MDKRYIISSIINEHDFDMIDIMNIIIDYNIDYSTNSNGLFINLSLLGDNIIDIIYSKILNLKLTKSEKQAFVDTKHLCSNKDNLINSDEYNEKDELVFTNIDKFILSLSKQTLTI